MTTEQIKPTNVELVDALGADSVEYHKGGFRLLVGGKTVAYGQEVKSGLRLRVLIADLPKKLTTGLKIVPLPSKANLTVYVTPEQTGKVRPILDAVAHAKAKA